MVFLREYVYVDVDRVGGLAGQLYDGVPERATNVVARHKKFEVDLKLIRGGGDSGSEDAIERNVADSLFKDLESDLEALGILNDVTGLLAENSDWNSFNRIISPGRILRVTAAGTLFHPAQMSGAIVGIATAAVGLGELGLAVLTEDEDKTPVRPPRAKTDAQKRAERAARQQSSPAPEPRFPEDFLPPFDQIPVMDVSRAQLSGMIKVARGVFGEGVHLHLRPRGVDGPTISSRLEPGRRFLDSSPEILFSRYGLAEQDWTVVGVVGQLGSAISPDAVDDITNADGSVNRAKFVDLVGQFLGETAGLVDLPQAPGFSIIPLAVYRAIGDTTIPETASTN